MEERGIPVPPATNTSICLAGSLQGTLARRRIAIIEAQLNACTIRQAHADSYPPSNRGDASNWRIAIDIDAV
jgi:hypothetical protein